MSDGRFRAGDQVFVRSPQEILATLDDNGTLDRVPFMPEMMDWCGKLFRVLRRVEKTCVADHPARRFPAHDVVILDGTRCDGTGHDGCKHGCRIFWKEAWLRPMEEWAATSEGSQSDLTKLRARLKVKSDERHYFCQSTELLKSTEAFPRTRRLWRFRIPIREIRSGDVSIWQLLRLFGRWAWLRFWRMLGSDRRLCGPHKRTPRESLGLKPGEIVRVKSLAEIKKTLNADGRNRGLAICHEMARCCGREAEVRCRVDRLIDEHTGAMRQITDTVTLQNVGDYKSLAEECLCQSQLGDCPRGELMYWREIWLERVNPNGQADHRL
jgi:hypothetical protein